MAFCDFLGASANRASATERDSAALPSDAAPDPDFGGPGGTATQRLAGEPCMA